VGESGSGKTTLISCLTRLMDSNALVSAGSYTFAGQDMLTKSASEMRAILGQDITMVFQDPMNTLNPLVTVEKQMVDIQYRRQTSSKEKKKRTIEALQRVGIPQPEKRLGMYPFEFSGGQCQRISIAIATMMSPKLLLADEPTTALDATLQVQILNLLKKCSRTCNVPYCFFGRDSYFYAVKKVSFAVRPGETVALVGESGSGKTTLAHSVMRLLDICEGKTGYCAVDYHPQSKYRATCGRPRFDHVHGQDFGAG